MKIVLISGSSRAGSQSGKVARWLEAKLSGLGVETEILDLHQVALPLQHEDIWDEIENNETAKKVRATLEGANGFVVITPEWNGMSSPALKNLFVYVGHTMANKPAYLVSVSAYRGGAYPIAELRMNSAKNSFVNYIPEHLIIRGAEDFMNDSATDTGSKDDQYIKGRAVYGLKILVEYAKALDQVRGSGVIDYETYQNGM
jgi:azobenzene reductase